MEITSNGVDWVPHSRKRRHSLQLGFFANPYLNGYSRMNHYVSLMVGCVGPSVCYNFQKKKVGNFKNKNKKEYFPHARKKMIGIIYLLRRPDPSQWPSRTRLPTTRSICKKKYSEVFPRGPVDAYCVAYHKTP